MRREHLFRMPEPEALELFRRVPIMHLATTSADGSPVLRALNVVMVDGAPCFHGSPTGEKAEALGRPAVAQVEEVIADIPSYFIDDERACPATTLFRSAQIHGVLEAVESLEDRARVLQSLMEKLQPEGRHVPITADHPLYRGPVKGLLIVRLRPERIDGKAKLGQNRSGEENLRTCEHLWRRGSPGDPRAIELIVRANPKMPLPGFLRGPEGVRLSCALDESDLDAAMALVRAEYWNAPVSEAQLRRALTGSSAWVGARAPDGTLIAQARAVSDGGKVAWIFDVATVPGWRRKGIGEALMRMLLDHPRVRGARAVRLHTRDAVGLYRKLGFQLRDELPPTPYRSIEMGLIR